MHLLPPPRASHSVPCALTYPPTENAVAAGKCEGSDHRRPKGYVLVKKGVNATDSPHECNTTSVSKHKQNEIEGPVMDDGIIKS